jgi:hypothetical protein
VKGIGWGNRNTHHAQEMKYKKKTNRKTQTGRERLPFIFFLGGGRGAGFAV